MNSKARALLFRTVSRQMILVKLIKIFLRSLKTTAENHGFDFCPRSFMKEDFSQKVQMLQEKIPSKQITDYLLDNWCTDKWGCQWANYGRHLFYEDQDTNNLVESKMVVPSPYIQSTSIDETRQELKEDKETTDQAIKRKKLRNQYICKQSKFPDN
ncbi:unnamed protein product [Mytilus coruscus]|uniref:Uncharacterized protein n=1 Tax=Mytilus coruscus TaxID=42192 RepID=A0A6J8CJB3_MYTCO|nr:unnamed protein product [Mytilus coruscus]